MAVVLLTKETLASSAAPQSKFPVGCTIRPNAFVHTCSPNILPVIVAIDRFRKETYRVFGVLEIRLSGKYTGEPRDYLAGQGKGKFSVADIGTWPWVKNWSFGGYTEEEMKAFPHLLKWIDRIAERPAVKIATGDKYRKTA